MGCGCGGGRSYTRKVTAPNQVRSAHVAPRVIEPIRHAPTSQPATRVVQSAALAARRTAPRRQV